MENNFLGLGCYISFSIDSSFHIYVSAINKSQLFSQWNLEAKSIFQREVEKNPNASSIETINGSANRIAGLLIEFQPAIDR